MEIVAPPGLQVGDVLVAALAARGRPVISAPAGWALVRSDVNGNSLALATFVHVASGTEPGSYAWQFSRSAAATATVMAFSGVDSSDPIDAAGGQTNAKSATVTAPSITTDVSGSLLLGVFGIANESSFEPPDGMSEISDVAASQAQYLISQEVASEQHAGIGITQSRSATANHAAFNIGQLIALRPAGSGAGAASVGEGQRGNGIGDLFGWLILAAVAASPLSLAVRGSRTVTAPAG
jgi:hypothetical protein